MSSIKEVNGNLHYSIKFFKVTTIDFKTPLSDIIRLRKGVEWAFKRGGGMLKSEGAYNRYNTNAWK